MKVAVVIPSYKVTNNILAVLAGIGKEVDAIYVVDDCCPDKSGEFVSQHCSDARVKVLRHKKNKGVGGAVVSGYREALKDKMEIILKVDGDGQMDPTLIPLFIAPIINGEADYTKGNRFFNLDDAVSMPKLRYFGNISLSFLTKLSSGYWKIFDPTNGYTAISSKVLSLIALDKLSEDYFFESDLLFRLGLCRAKVVDIPMQAKYADENSHLNVKKIIFPFLKSNLKNFRQRMVYNYFIRDFSIASVELILGTLLFIFGCVFGGAHWIDSIITDIPATSGAVMITGLSIIVSIQLLLSFLSFDIDSIPKETMTSKL